MKTELKTLTARQVAKILMQMPDARVFVASDEEGNSFGTVGTAFSFQDDNGDLLIFPAQQFCDDNYDRFDD